MKLAVTFKKIITASLSESRSLIYQKLTVKFFEKQFVAILQVFLVILIVMI